MNKNRCLNNTLVAFGLAAAMVTSLAAQTAIDGSAKVIRKSGDARFKVGGGDWQPLHVGDVLKAGTLIQTGKAPGSYVDVILGEAGGNTIPAPVAFKPSIPTSTPAFSYQGGSGAQNVVRVWQDSILGIDKLTSQGTGADEVSETQLDLKAGRVTGSVKKMSAASKYEVKLPNGVAGIRGTVYDITADGVIRVASGSVVVAYQDANGQIVTRTINSGESFDTKTNTPGTVSAAEIAQMIEATTVTGYVPPPATIQRDNTLYTISPSTGP